MYRNHTERFSEMCLSFTCFQTQRPPADTCTFVISRWTSKFHWVQLTYHSVCRITVSGETLVSSYKPENKTVLSWPGTLPSSSSSLWCLLNLWSLQWAVYYFWASFVVYITAACLYGYKWHAGAKQSNNPDVHSGAQSTELRHLTCKASKAFPLMNVFQAAVIMLTEQKSEYQHVCFFNHF